MQSGPVPAAARPARSPIAARPGGVAGRGSPGWSMTETMHKTPLELLTVERVAGLLSCSQRYIYDQVKAGRLVGTKLGRSVKISRQNL